MTPARFTGGLTQRTTSLRPNRQPAKARGHQCDETLLMFLAEDSDVHRSGYIAVKAGANFGW